MLVVELTKRRVLVVSVKVIPMVPFQDKRVNMIELIHLNNNYITLRVESIESSNVLLTVDIT